MTTNVDLVLSRCKQRKILIERILENNVEKVLARFRNSSDYKGKIILDFANLREADFKYANLFDVSLIGANLSGVSFIGGRFFLGNKSFCSLRGALLAEVELHGQNLAGIDLAHANLTGSKLDGTNFSKAILYGATFDYADCMDAIFTDAVLKKTANSIDGNFGEASFENTNIYRATFNEKNVGLMKKIREKATESVGDFLTASTKRREKFFRN